MLIWWGLACPAILRASVTEYMCEVGAQVGCGYYVGDASKMIFSNPREVLGGQFRYNFDSRWAMQIKAQRQRIAFAYTPSATEDVPRPAKVRFVTPAWHVDATAEFNFFRFGLHPFDSRIKPITPFISVGIGISARNKVATRAQSGTVTYPSFKFLNMNSPAFYVPIGIGVKWKFAERWQLQACWQHQIYLSDNLEGYLPKCDNEKAIKDYGPSLLNNPNDLNGSNLFNNDLVSTLTVGVVFEFGKRTKMCYFCDE